MSDMIAEQRDACVKSLASVFAQIEAAAGQQKEKSDALQTASAATLSAKEQMFTHCADIAFKANWCDDAVDAAITIALAARGDAQKIATIKTFSSELRLAMHSRVRQAVPNLFTLGREAWAEEQAALKANKEAPSPLSTAWPRCTMMLVALMRDIKEHQGSAYPDKQSIVAFGVANDPATDDEKIARKLKTMVRQFNAFHAEFPVTAFKDIVGYLSKIDTKVLGAARAKMLAEKAGSVEPAAFNNLRKPEPVAGAPVEGASDILGDALRDANAG